MRHTPDVLFFWEHGCPNCKRIYPGLVKFMRRMTRDVSIKMINVNRNKRLANRYDVRGTPTLIINKHGCNPVSIEGALTSGGYIGYLEKYLEEWLVY